MEKEKLSKKQIIPLVIGILTMVILVSSATYAYFKVSIGNTATSTTITGDIGGGTLGTITLDGGGTNLYLGVSAYDMSESKKGTTYYSSTTEGSRETNVNNAGKTTYTATLTGDESDSVMYACDYEFTVTSNGTALEKESISDISVVFEGDIKKTLPLSASGTVSGTWFGFKNSNKERTFNAYLQLTNTEVEQNDLAGKNISVEISNTKWNCYLSENDELIGDAYALYTESDSTLTFIRSETPINVGDIYNDSVVNAVYTGFEEVRYSYSDDNVPWRDDGINKVNFVDEIRPISTARWFRTMTSNLDLTNLNTSLVTDMSGMFEYSSISNIVGIANWDVSNVTNMLGMFLNTEMSQDLDLGEWDVSNVENMSYMFAQEVQWLIGYEVVGIDKWNVSNVTNMEGMFFNTQMSKSLDLSGWDVSNVTDMSGMFEYSDLSNIVGTETWDVSNVENMSYMFAGARINTDINLSNWDVSSVTDMSYMFAQSPELPNEFMVLGIDKWNVSNVTNMEGMFTYSTINTNIDLSEWDVSNVTNMKEMFYVVILPDTFSLDLSGWDVSNVTSYSRFFSELNDNWEIIESNKITPPKWPTTT